MIPVDRLRRAASDLFGLFVFPMLVAALPWAVGLRLLKGLARHHRTFRVEADAAWVAANAHLPGMEADTWKTRYRLIRWVERADTYLTLTRTTGWWRRRVDVIGDWPAPAQAHLLLTFHWGAGNWVWKLLSEQGIGAHFLARRPVARDLGAGGLALSYSRLREWAFPRIGGRGAIYTGGSAARIEEALEKGASLVAMLDLPSSPSQQPTRVMLLGEPARLPARLLAVAAKQRVPITIFSCGFDAASGRRTLRMETLDASVDIESALARYAALLEACLREASEFWMMWHQCAAIFSVTGHTMAAE
ncbi:MAG TPA: hypothetical protein VGC55_11295 [Dokdonella sp.]